MVAKMGDIKGDISPEIRKRLVEVENGKHSGKFYKVLSRVKGTVGNFFVCEKLLW